MHICSQPDVPVVHSSISKNVTSKSKKSHFVGTLTNAAIAVERLRSAGTRTARAARRRRRQIRAIDADKTAGKRAAVQIAIAHVAVPTGTARARQQFEIVVIPDGIVARRVEIETTGTEKKARLKQSRSAVRIGCHDLNVDRFGRRRRPNKRNESNVAAAYSQ